MEKEELKFEEVIKNLEVKVKEVESSSLDLDKSVKAYEEGMEYIKLANKMLDDAERKIVALRKNANGEYEEEELI